MFNFKKFFKNDNTNLTTLFESSLGENLYSLIQYGSTVSGSANESSDINLLIILNRSTPEAHSAIHDIILRNPQIDPFIMGKRGFDRTVLSFAVKFLSISRHYKLLSGHDVLENLDINLAHERFLAEQALRNLRLKLVHSFAIKGPSKTYLRFITSLYVSFIVDISEILRCENINVPVKYNDRIATFDDKFDFDVSVLEQLSNIKNHTKKLSHLEINNLHRNAFILLDNIVLYIETEWNE